MNAEKDKAEHIFPALQQPNLPVAGEPPARTAGARTFLSAASRGVSRTLAVFGAGERSRDTADKNVRAPPHLPPFCSALIASLGLGVRSGSLLGPRRFQGIKRDLNAASVVSPRYEPGLFHQSSGGPRVQPDGAPARRVAARTSRRLAPKTGGGCRAGQALRAAQAHHQPGARNGRQPGGGNRHTARPSQVERPAPPEAASAGQDRCAEGDPPYKNA